MNDIPARVDRCTRTHILALACAFAVLAQAAAAETFYEREPADIFMEEAREVTIDVVSVAESGTVKAELSNGMVVLLKENHTAPIAIVQVTVKAGSLYEQEYLGAGISHLLEHLTHGGTTTTRTEEETKEILQSLGNMTNAYTSFDSTSYFIKGTKGDIDTAIELLADWMINTQVTDTEFDREMKVVQREAERANTSPNRILFELARQSMFRVHPVRYPILGYDHVRAKLTLEDARRYRARMYVPNNMLFVAVGDFKWPELLEKIRSAFANFRRGASPSVSLPQEPEQVSMRMMKKGLADLNTNLLSMSYRTVRLTHPDLYPLDVFAAVLGQGESSRLQRTIKNELNLVQSISAWSYTPGYDAGRFTVFASIPEAKNVDEVRAAVDEHIKRFKTELVDDAELERVKNKVAADHVYGSQKIESQARSLISSYLSAGDPDFDTRYVAGIQKVTAKEVLKVANKYFSGDRLCVTMVEPEGEGPSERGAREAIEASAVRKTGLKNGLTLLLKRNPNVPIVAFELYFLAGLRAETQATNGISGFTAQAWSRGTKNRSPVELAAELENMGANLSTGSGNNTFFLRATCLSKDFDKMVDIVADVVLNPAFGPDECDKLRVRILNAIKERDDSVYAQAQHLLQETYYGEGSPYAMDMNGTAETVNKLSAKDLANFYREYSRGPNGVLAVYGDIDPAEAEKIMAKAFAKLSAKPAPEIKPAPAPKLEKDEQVVAYRERKDATAVYFAFPGTQFTNTEDRYPMKLLDVVLSGGGHPGGWLHEALRGAGLVYEVHAFNILGLDPRHFQIQAITNPAAVDEVKAIIIEKIEKMKKGEITEEEFRRAKKICITEELMSRQTNTAQAQTAAIDELYGLGYDFDSFFAERIEAVTIEDVVRVANKYLTHYVCVVVTQKPAEPEEPKTE